jgi:HPt (histidine-containing phosphotransfer) domain-containing protein
MAEPHGVSLGRNFGLLVATLLVGSAITGGAGVYGLQRLDASLDHVVSLDMPRLMTITDLRRRVRMMVVAEGSIIHEQDAAKAAKLENEIVGSRTAIAELVTKYEPLVLATDRESWRSLLVSIDDWIALDKKVLALAAAQRTDEAHALHQTHSKAWEALIKTLIAGADKQLAHEAAETRSTFSTARLLVIAVFAISALLGLCAGFAIYRRIRSMLREMVRLKDRLQATNESLEKTVDERTRTIRAILDNVRFGFFLVDAKHEITDGYTRSLVELLGRDDLAGRRASECLGFAGDMALEFDVHLSQIFEDILPPEVSCDQIPARIVRDGRVLRIQASVVRSPTETIAQVLFCVTDVTDLEVAERQNRETQTVLHALKNPEPFKRFIADLNTRFSSIRDAVQLEDDPRARRELHTIKGNASCYGLLDIARGAHAIEERDRIELVPVIDLEREFQAFLASNFDVLGIDGDRKREEVYRVEGASMERLEKTIEDATSLELLRAQLRAQLVEMRWILVGSMLGPLATQVETLGERLGKSVTLRVVGGELRVPPSQLGPLIAVLPHMIRNSIDHGIEDWNARGDKPAESCLVLSFEDTGSSWKVTFVDDGRGIDVETLRERAVALGLLQPTDRPAHEALCALIFTPKITTATEVTEISGRGEGMASVADAAHRLGARIVVTSVRGTGTEISFDIPKHCTALSRAA